MNNDVDKSGSVFNSTLPPRDSDILFGANTEDWQLNACISHWGNADFAYKAGFRVAAIQLTERMCDNPSSQDCIVYPIVYLYRHHIELALKNVIRLSAQLLDQSISNNQLRTHDLSRLWQVVRAKLNPICRLAEMPQLPKADIDGIDSYMRQLNNLDPSGESFRYAHRNDASPSLRPDLLHINLRMFAIHMEKLADYLDGLENWLDLLVSGRNQTYG